MGSAPSPAAGQAAGDVVAAFYDRHPYPPPVDDLDAYRRRWADPTLRRVEHLRYWPDRPQGQDLRVLVAGCGTSQAARHAIRRPSAHVVGIDVSPSSIAHTRRLADQHGLSNLQVHDLAIEDIAALDETFDLIICTGVLHHLADPEAGLRALAGVLAPDGALHLMVYARHGRHGIDLLREYAGRLGIGTSDEEVEALMGTLAALPPDHPLADLLASPDFRRPDAVADALLNPRERSYTVAELFELLAGTGLAFGSWQRRASYLPWCGSLRHAPHVDRLVALREPDRSAAVELLRGTIARHSVIAHQDGRGPSRLDGPDDPRWPAAIPVRNPSTVVVTDPDRLPDGAAAVLVNREHTHRDLWLPLRAQALPLVQAIDGAATVAELAGRVGLDAPSAVALVHQLWSHDHIEADLTHTSRRRRGA